MNNNSLSGIIKGLRERDIEFIENESLSSYTSIKIGGDCDVIIFPKDERGLLFVIDLIGNNSKDYVIIGRGTNTLFRNNPVNVPVISFKKGFSHIQETNSFERKNIKLASKTYLRVGSGVTLSQVLNYAIKHSLGGCEFFFGIPGTVGGAVRMNAGSKENVMGDIVENVDIITKNGVKLTVEKKDLQFSYRNLDNGIGGKNYFITGATLSLTASNKARILKNINMFKERKSGQPLGKYSLGCIFKNPPDLSAGKIIEEIGFKGFSNGNASVSDKHANFIINKGGADAEDVLGLIESIKKTVLLRKGIKLSTEIKII